MKIGSHLVAEIKSLLALKIIELIEILVISEFDFFDDGSDFSVEPEIFIEELTATCLVPAGKIRSVVEKFDGELVETAGKKSDNNSNQKPDNFNKIKLQIGFRSIFEIPIFAFFAMRFFRERSKISLLLSETLIKKKTFGSHYLFDKGKHRYVLEKKK